MHMLPVFFAARLLVQIIHAWLAGKWPGWDWAVSAGLTAALWPLAVGAAPAPARRRRRRVLVRLTAGGRNRCSSSRKPASSKSSASCCAPVGGVFALLCFGVLIGRFWYLQVDRYEGLSERADRNRIADPRRGEILTAMARCWRATTAPLEVVRPTPAI